MGLISVAPNEIFNLSGALVSDYLSYKVANLEWSTPSGIIKSNLYLSHTYNVQ